MLLSPDCSCLFWFTCFLPHRYNFVTKASEPEQNPKNSLQFTETLPIARLQQASPLVQMQWKRGASEPCRKAEFGSQTTHSKRIARLSATTPMVQIPTGFGTPQNANAYWKHFWQGYPPNTQQNSPCIWTETKPKKFTATHWETFRCKVSTSTFTGSDAVEKGSIWTVQKGRIRQPNRSQQMRCKKFSNYAWGSDPRRAWNTTECKYALEALLAGVSTKRAAEQHMHLNRNKT